MRAQLVAVLVATGIAGPVRAGEVAEPGWTVGAGLASVAVGPGIFVGSPSALRFQSGLGAIPAFAFFAERRLGSSAWLLAQGTAAYVSDVDEIDPRLLGETTVAAAAVGPRFVLNRGAPVEISAFVLGGAAYGYGLQRTRPSPDAIRQETKFTSWSAGARFGMAFERELVGGLAVRLSSGILGASWYRTTSRTDAGGRTRDQVKLHGVDAGLSFSPGLELRFAF